MDAHFWNCLVLAMLWIAGFWNAFQPGMIFGKAGDWAEWAAKAVLGKNQGEFVLKPILRCPPCMASLHGTVLWFLLGGTLAVWPLFVVCLSGALTLLFRVLPSDT